MIYNLDNERKNQERHFKMMRRQQGAKNNNMNHVTYIPVSVLTHVGGPQAVVKEGQLLSLLLGLSQHLIEWKNN